MIQVHGKTILSMKFKSIIKTHGLNPWQFIYPKLNSHWQYQNPILIGNIKAQFLLAIFKTQFSLATSKLNFHWQYQNPVLTGNIKAQFSLAISKAQLTLALLKTQANYLVLFYRKPEVINTWQNTTSQLFHLKVQ